MSSIPSKPPSSSGSSLGRTKRGGRAPFRHEAERHCLLRVCCEPGSDILDELETFVSAYLKRRFRPSLAQSVATASYELCSNAISYASVATDVTFELHASSSFLEVEVANEAVSARLGILKQIVERIQNDPEAAYLEEMRRSLAGKMPRAMLGLARVTHEAGMELDVQINERRVKVVARCRR